MRIGKDGTREPLAGMDAAMLRLETPTNLMVINGVMILGAPVDFGDLRAVIRDRLLAIPRFRQRLAPAAGPLSTPCWEDDPSFNIDNHLYRLVLPPPAGQGALQDLISELASMPLDRSRPLWAFYLVEGYGPGCALVCRIHHCIGDGISLIEVLLSITDMEPGVPPGLPAVRKAERPRRGRRRRARKLLRRGLSLAAHPERVRPLVRRARRVLASGRRAASALEDILLSPPDSQTSFKGELGVPKRVAWSGPIALDEVKAIGRALDGTVNDVLLAAASGALRRYLEGRGEAADGIELHAAVPVNLRGADTAGRLGNRVGTVFAPLPVGVADPVGRLEAVRRSMDGLKRSSQAPATFAAMRALGRTRPPVQRAVVGMMAGRATAIMTNVVGPGERRYLAGVPLEALLFWVPKTGGLALGVSILSYAGQVRLGVITDRGLVPDPETIVAAFEAEFDGLLALAGQVRPAATAAELLAMLDEALATLASIEPDREAGS
ncbi:MAG: wax ester/triacylglycerol synthase family O-acyltransferase [Anaerolineae bacterium]|jgi:WS/DGAT/MGAT family acyltransferase